MYIHSDIGDRASFSDLFFCDSAGVAAFAFLAVEGVDLIEGAPGLAQFWGGAGGYAIVCWFS